jgi:hypothetical protein
MTDTTTMKKPKVIPADRQREVEELQRLIQELREAVKDVDRLTPMSVTARRLIRHITRGMKA